MQALPHWPLLELECQLRWPRRLSHRLPLRPCHCQSVLKASNSDTVTEVEIREAVHTVIEKEPNPEEIHQVAARLASVGWPLAAPAR